MSDGIKIEPITETTMLNELEDLLDGMTDTQRERVAKAVAAIRAAHKADTQASEKRIIEAVSSNRQYWTDFIFELGRWVSGKAKR